jgi:hypothetical protein
MSEHEKVVDAINALVYEYAHGGTDKVRSIIAAALSSARDVALEAAAVQEDLHGMRSTARRIRALKSRPVQVVSADRVREVAGEMLRAARPPHLTKGVHAEQHAKGWSMAVRAFVDHLGVDLDATGGRCPTYGCMQGPNHPGECDPLG